MIIKKLSDPLKSLDGQNMKTTILEEVKEDEKDEKDNITFKKGAMKPKLVDMILRDLLTNALFTDELQKCQFCGRAGVEEKIPGSEKARKCDLAIKIHNAKKEIDLDREDVEFIKGKVGEIYPSLVVGQAWRIIDPENKLAG